MIENTAFTADLALHFPDNFHRLYDKNHEWQTMLESSLGLTVKSGLIDDETLKALDLVSNKHNFKIKLIISNHFIIEENLFMPKIFIRYSKNVDQT